MFQSSEKFVENWSKQRELGFWQYMLRKGVTIGLICGICLSMFIFLDDYSLTKANFFSRAFKVTSLSLLVFNLFYMFSWVFYELAYLSETEW